VIKNWDYVGLIKAFQNGEGKLWTAEVGRSCDIQSTCVATRSRR
jgi:hypothetical protein